MNPEQPATPTGRAPQGQTSPLESTDVQHREGTLDTPGASDDGLASGGNRGAEQRREETRDGTRED
jgi:hypothetical protein